MQKQIKVLNLYCGIGGNRKLWENVDVWSIDNDDNALTAYDYLFPDDMTDKTCALKHLEFSQKKQVRKINGDFDFIQASPPCPTHGQFRQTMCVKRGQSDPVIPDMSLYALIIFLKHNCQHIKWVVENVKPYYTPLIEPTAIIDRHYFWANFEIKSLDIPSASILKSDNQIAKYQKLYGINLDDINVKDKRKLLRNCVDPRIGKHVLDCAFSPDQGLFSFIR